MLILKNIFIPLLILFQIFSSKANGQEKLFNPVNEKTQLAGGTSSNGGGDLANLVLPDEMNDREKYWSSIGEKINYFWTQKNFTLKMKKEIEKSVYINKCYNDSNLSYPSMPHQYEKMFKLTIENQKATDLVMGLCSSSIYNEIYWYFVYNILNLRGLNEGMSGFASYLIERVYDKFGPIPIVLVKEPLKITYGNYESAESTWVDQSEKNIKWTQNTFNKKSWGENAKLLIHEIVNWVQINNLGNLYPQASRWHNMRFVEGKLHYSDTTKETAFLEGVANVLARRSIYKEAFNAGALFQIDDDLCYSNYFLYEGESIKPIKNELYVGGAINALLFQNNFEKIVSFDDAIRNFPVTYSYSFEAYKEIVDITLNEKVISVEELAKNLDRRQKSNKALKWLREFFAWDYKAQRSTNSLFTLVEKNNKKYLCTKSENKNLFLFPEIFDERELLLDKHFMQLMKMITKDELDQKIQSLVDHQNRAVERVLLVNRDFPLEKVKQKFHSLNLCKKNSMEAFEHHLYRIINKIYDDNLKSTKGVFAAFSFNQAYNAFEEICNGSSIKEILSKQSKLGSLVNNKSEAIETKDVVELSLCLRQRCYDFPVDSWNAIFEVLEKF